ncbi:MAG: MarR family transcriptional regulator [Hyphomicrobiaceae bacterium]|nr:MAG: MarR family transcriptional regulator [Hyphomicrobiaceae bacterium]
MIAPGNDNNAIAAVTGLILEIFRLNGRLLEAGDNLVAPLGLTSARWQVLGAIDAAQTPRPVAHLARDMGLSRQAVQRLANEMEEAGIVRFVPNPHHERAKLVLMTSRGESLFKAAMRVQRLWAKTLSEGLDGDRMNRAAELLRSLRAKLERD